MPLQLALIVPFVRLGGWLVSTPAHPARSLVPLALEHFSAVNLATRATGMAGEALLAWLLAAIPAVLFMTLALNFMLRRIPVLKNARSGRLIRMSSSPRSFCSLERSPLHGRLPLLHCYREGRCPRDVHRLRGHVHRVGACRSSLVLLRVTSSAATVKPNEPTPRKALRAEACA